MNEANEFFQQMQHIAQSTKNPRLMSSTEQYQLDRNIYPLIITLKAYQMMA